MRRPAAAPPPARFDRVARLYRLLETVAFGGALQRSRVALLDQVGQPANVLILGEGDGRFSRELAARFPSAQITVCDASAEMIRLAAARHGPATKITFLHADALSQSFPPSAYDLIVTHYFLDCFDQAQVDDLVGRLALAATTDARWLLADFHRPAAGLARLHADLWLATMYFFFRIATGLKTTYLASPDPSLRTSGFCLQHERPTRWGLIRSTLWQRNGTHSPSN